MTRNIQPPRLPVFPPSNISYRNTAMYTNNNLTPFRRPVPSIVPSLPGLAIWLDGADASKVTASSVLGTGLWIDKAPVSRVFSADDGVFFNYPVTVGGSNALFMNPGLLIANLVYTDPLAETTAFFVVRLAADTINSITRRTGGLDGLTINTATGAGVISSTNDSGTSNYSQATNVFNNTGSAHIVRHKKSNGGVNVQLAVNSIVLGNYVPALPANDTIRDIANGVVNGYFCEIIVTNSNTTLIPAQIIAVESYLRAKWGTP